MEHLNNTAGPAPLPRQDTAARRSSAALTPLKHHRRTSSLTFSHHNLPSPSSTASFPLHDHDDSNPPSRDNCDRRRPDEEDTSRLPNMSQQLVGQSVTPFLREHIPGLYAPIGKPDFSATHDNSSNTRDPNSKFCYRHRPDSKCRKAADESKMGAIQSELEKLPQADQQAITHVWSLFSAAPAKHRELMLQGVITQCCFPQLSMVSREISESLKIDFLSALPTEISLKVLRFLDCVSLCKASQVSHRWRTLADDDLVWQHLCIQHIERKCTSCGWALPRLETKRLINWKRQHQLAVARIRQTEVVELPDDDTPSAGDTMTLVSRKRDASTVESTEVSGAKRQCSEGAQWDKVEPQFRPWKDVYRDRFRIGSNWRYGRCSMKIFRGQHTNGITCLQFLDKENILATGSYDSTIKLWDMDKATVIRTLTGHTMGIRALYFDSRVLVSGSLDGSVKIFNWRTGVCINTLRHNGGVITVHMDGDFLASGSMDRTIKVFNFKTQQIVCLRGHTDYVNQVKIDVASRTLLSCSDDCTVRLWDLDTQRCLRTYEGHCGQVQQVMPLPDDYEFEGDDGHEADDASVASNRSSTPGLSSSGALLSPPADDERAAYGHDFIDNLSRPVPPRYMLTGSLDATLRLWDTASGKCLRTFFGHVEGIWSLVGDSLRYVTGANDATVKVWDPRSGKCERTFTGHEGPVTAVALSDSRLASGGEDGEVRLYRFDCDPSEAAACGTPS